MECNIWSSFCYVLKRIRYCINKRYVVIYQAALCCCSNSAITQGSGALLTESSAYKIRCLLMGQVAASIIKSQCLLKNVLFLTDVTIKNIHL